MRFVLIFIGICIPAVLHAQVVFTEVRWAGSDVSSADEWFSIQNISDADVDISGWQITTRKSSGDHEPMIIFEDRLLQAGQLLLISNYSQAKSALKREPDIVAKAVSLPNTKLLLRILDADGTRIDQADDGIGTPLAGGKDPYKSMIRSDVHGDGAVEGSWREEDADGANDEVAEDAENDDEGAEVLEGAGVPSVPSVPSAPFAPSMSPAKPNSLTITSVIPRPESGNRKDQKITLTYTGGRRATLDGWKLDNREGGSASVLLDGITVNSNEAVSFSAQWLGLSFTPERDIARLIAPDGEVVSMLTWNTPARGEIIRPIQESDMRMQAEILHADTYGIEIALVPESFNGLYPQVERYWARSAHKYLHPHLSVKLLGIQLIDELTLKEGTTVYIDIQSITWHPQPILHAYVYDDTQVLLQEKLLKDGSAVVANENHPRRYMFMALQSAEADEVIVENCEPQQEINVKITAAYPSPQEGEQEWIEIINTGEEQVDLCGLVIDDIADGGSKSWVIPTSIVLGEGDTYTFKAKDTGIRLNNSGDAISISYASGSVIDEVAYSSSKKGMQIEFKNEEQKMYSTSSSSSSSQNPVDMLPVRYVNIEPVKVQDPRIDKRLIPLVEAKKRQEEPVERSEESGLPWMLLFGQSAIWLVIAGRKYI